MDSAAPSPRRIKIVGAIVFFSTIVAVGFCIRSQLDAAEISRWLGAASGWIEANRILAALIFAAIYIVLTGLSFPGATIVTLIGGSVFGFWIGMLVVTFASTIGATLAMLSARYFLRDWIERRFPQAVARINKGVATDGPRYLFALRLVPAFPFFLVNLAMGLTRMKVFTFAWVSLLGMFPGTIVYVNAGQQLSTIENAGDILSMRVILAFVALAALPFVAKAGTSWWMRRKALRAWNKPNRFDYNLIVIGAGSAGLVTAYIAATARARVALIEQGAMGGDCLNTGCVPSKALIRSAKLAKEGAHPEHLGLTGRLDPDFAAIMRRIREVIARIAPHDSIERYTRTGRGRHHRTRARRRSLDGRGQRPGV